MPSSIPPTTQSSSRSLRPGHQLTFLEDDQQTDDIVNVASVPLRSPFRYPGGKTWLVPRAKKWLRSQPSKPSVLIEPFAGGAIIGLTAAFEGLVERVILYELDPNVSAVWEMILGGDAEALANRILEFQVTLENVREILAKQFDSSSDMAFQTIIRNRMQHGGIMAPGASLIKTGEYGRGLASRWYPRTLAKRIREISTIRAKIKFKQCDSLAQLETHLDDDQAVFFADPPYTAGGITGKRAGSRLYKHSQLDHERLFKLMSRSKGDFLMTYDNAEDVRALATKFDFQCQCVAMKNTHHAKMDELLIGRSMAWLNDR